MSVSTGRYTRYQSASKSTSVGTSGSDRPVGLVSNGMTTKAIGAGIDLSRMTLTTPLARRGCMCCVSTPSGLPELAEKYAPVVVLHAEEKLRPAPAAWFLERCSLR